MIIQILLLSVQAMSNSNLDKFGLNGSDPTHITEKGLYNADIYCTGDGVTNADALEIQNILLSNNE